MHDTVDVSERWVEWDRLRPFLEDAMHDLRASDRDVLLLRFFEHRPFGDIARETGLGENAARMRVDRALGKLRSAFARRGIDSTAIALETLLLSHSLVAAPSALAASVKAAAFAATATTTATTAITSFTLMNSAKMTIIASLLATVAAVVGVRQTLELRHVENVH